MVPGTHPGFLLVLALSNLVYEEFGAFGREAYNQAYNKYSIFLYLGTCFMFISIHDTAMCFPNIMAIVNSIK